MLALIFMVISKDASFVIGTTLNEESNFVLLLGNTFLIILQNIT